MDTKKPEKSDSVRLWFRAGVSWDASPDTIKAIIDGDSGKIAELLKADFKAGKAFFDGDCYFPDDIYSIVSDEDREKLTETQRRKLEGATFDIEP